MSFAGHLLHMTGERLLHVAVCYIVCHAGLLSRRFQRRYHAEIRRQERRYRRLPAAEVGSSRYQPPLTFVTVDTAGTERLHAARAVTHAIRVENELCHIEYLVEKAFDGREIRRDAEERMSGNKVVTHCHHSP